MSSQNRYTPDSHSIIWYLTAQPAITRKAKAALDNVFDGEGVAYVSAILWLEVWHACLNKEWMNFEKIKNGLTRPNIFTVPLGQEILDICYSLPKILGIHDRIIAATAKLTGSTLITKDPILRKVPGLKTLW